MSDRTSIREIDVLAYADGSLDEPARTARVEKALRTLCSRLSQEGGDLRPMHPATAGEPRLSKVK